MDESNVATPDIGQDSSLIPDANVQDEDYTPDAASNYVPVFIQEEGNSEPIQVLLPRHMLEDTDISYDTILEKLGFELSQTQAKQDASNNEAAPDISTLPFANSNTSAINPPESYVTFPEQSISPVGRLQDTGEEAVNAVNTAEKSDSSESQKLQRDDPPSEAVKTVASARVQSQKVKIRHSEEESVTIDVAVANKNFRKYIPFVGFNFTFACKKCKYSAKSFDNLIAHIDERCPFRKSKCRPKKDSKPPNDANGTGEKKEHSYATKSDDAEHTEENLMSQCGPSVGETSDAHDAVRPTSAPNEGTNQMYETKSNLSVRDVHGDTKLPRKYFCAFCPYTLMHSEVEWKLHMDCHNSPDDPKMTCCMCKTQAMASVKDTRNWSQLKAHLAKKHGVDFKLDCKECDLVLSNHVALREHMQTHVKRCDNCRFSTISQTDLDTHQACHDATDPKCFRCLICGYRCKREPSKWPVMLAHLVAKHQGVVASPYHCETCGKGFQGLRSFTDHSKICTGMNTIVETAKLQCKICNDNVAISHIAGHMKSCKKKNWNNLIESMIQEGIITQIPDCKPNITSDTLQCTNLKDCAASDEEIKQVTLEAKNLRCLKHAVKFENEELLVDHYIQDHLCAGSETQESVGQMDVEFPTEVDIEVEDDGDTAEQNMSPDEDFGTSGSGKVKCVVCYKKFTSNARLEKHIRKVHTADRLKPVECNICGKFFKTATRRRNHIREVHELKRRKKIPKVNNKPAVHFICEDCGYVTPSKDRLKNHQLAVHVGILPFQCNQCEYKTSERADLVRHKYKHTGVKKHCCQHCSYKTNERWVLVNHCLRQHDVHLPKLSRNTTGLPGSLRWQQAKERKRQLEQAKQEAEVLQGIQAMKQDPSLQEQPPDEDLQEGASFAFQNTASVVSHIEGMETVGANVNEIVVPMDQASEQDVFYIQTSDLTESEQAALMLVSVGPSVPEAQDDVTLQP